MESAKIRSSKISPTLCLRGQVLGFEQPRLMGILNVNADSFYHSSRVEGVDAALDLAGQMVEQGADFIDIGASSSRPGAALSFPGEEWDRIAPVLHAVRKTFPNQWVSVDTYHADVARQAIEAGADLINDVSGGELDPDMLSYIIQENVPYLLMHMRGTPESMQEKTSYKDVVTDVIFELAAKVNRFRQLGHSNLIIDPGFGFAKTLEQNYQLLCHLDALRIFNAPILAGVSRKSMVTRVLGIQAEEALNGTTALHMLLLQRGVHILRVHDVKAAREAVRIHTFAKALAE
jgi:dihydropteroate synthase